MQGLRDYARTLRAVTAVCAAATLAVVLFANEHARATAKERAVYAVNAILWKTSELIFETQRLQADLAAYRAGQRPREAAALRFDILWSRLDLLDGTILHDLDGFDTQLDRYQTLLEAREPLVFGDRPPPAAQIERFESELEELCLGARQIWNDAFAGEMAVMDLLHNAVPDDPGAPVSRSRQG